MNVQTLANISIEPKEMRSWEGGFAQITVGQSRFQSMQDGRCKMEDGRWPIEDATWKTQDARCKMQGGRWKTKGER